MDAITELENSLDTLLKVMASAIAYLSRKAGHQQVNAAVPLTTLGNTEGLTPEALAASRDELVDDLVAQARDVERRIYALPCVDATEAVQMERIGALEARLQEANQDYRAALDEAHTLSAQVNGLLARLCDERHAAREQLEKASGCTQGHVTPEGRETT